MFFQWGDHGDPKKVAPQGEDPSSSSGVHWDLRPSQIQRLGAMVPGLSVSRMAYTMLCQLFIRDDYNPE